MKLRVFIEIKGKQTFVGNIEGNRSADARFTYSGDYLEGPESHGISLSLPLQTETFSAEQTKNYFEGLLPEGFSRRSVANWIHSDADDYLVILKELGKECLGAVRILEEEETVEARYRKVSDREILELAKEGALKSAELVTKSHLSLTGASGKVGLYFDEDSGKWFMPLGSAPSTHIVKQSHVRLKDIVANEQLSLKTAQKLGIEIPESFILKTSSTEKEDILLATKRFDRDTLGGTVKLQGHRVPLRLHQEDFAQALGVNSLKKYEEEGQSYLKDMFTVLANHSSDPVADQLKLWDMIIFNSLIGNTDCHLKNIGLLYSADLEQIRLAPAYDIVSTIVYGESTRKMAFRIGHQKEITLLTREDFKEAAQECGLGEKLAMSRYDFMLNNFEKALSETTRELKAEGFGQAVLLKNKILKAVSL